MTNVLDGGHYKWNEHFLKEFLSQVNAESKRIFNKHEICQIRTMD